MLNNYGSLDGRKLDKQHLQMTPCLQCKQTNTPCDYVIPTCTNCSVHHITCQYETIPINVREIDSRLRKLESALTAKQRTPQPSSLSPDLSITKTIPDSVSPKTNHHTTPQFTLAPNGINIETSIKEPHHFVKLLFNGIDPTKIQQRAQDIFGKKVPPFRFNRTNTLPNMDSFSNNPLEKSWLEMVLMKRHFRCFVIYQMVDRQWLTQYLFNEQNSLTEQQQLLAHSIRAYIYSHEDMLHDDTPYPLKNRKGELCFQQAQELLERCYTISDRDTIRALLHLYQYQVQKGEVNNACQLIDLALRIAQDLKLNQPTITGDRRAEDDRRLWWSVYWKHLHMAAEYNRPTMTEESSCQLPYPRKLEDEGSDVGYCIDFSIHHLKLIQIHLMVAKKLKAKATVNSLLATVQDIEHQLENWTKELPEHTMPEHWVETTDPLCIELAIILRCRLESTKIYIFECFKPWEDQPASFMELLAIRNCMRAATNITDMIVRYGNCLRMCICADMLSIIQQCVSVHMANARSTIPEIAMSSKQKLQDMAGVLSNHSFAYVHEARTLVASIHQSFSAPEQPEPETTPLPSIVNDPTPSTSATPPTLDLSPEQLKSTGLLNSVPQDLDQTIPYAMQSFGFPLTKHKQQQQQPFHSSIFPSSTFDLTEIPASHSSDTINATPFAHPASLNRR